jgi:hypothetical protein
MLLLYKRLMNQDCNKLVSIRREEGEGEEANRERKGRTRSEGRTWTYTPVD